MRYIQILLLLLLAASSCRKDKVTTPTKTPTNTASQPIDTKTGQATTQTTKPNNNPPTTGNTPPATPSGAVFFVSPTKGLLAPLACYDNNAKSFIPEEECLALLPKGATLRSEQDKTITFSPKASSDNCFMGKTFDGSDSSFALWPQDTAAKLSRPTPMEKPDANDKKLIEKAVRAKTKEAYQITSSVSLDLNGDQKLDRIYSVVAKKTKKGEDTSNPFAFSALLLVDGKKGSALVTLVSSSNETFSLLGAIDLDANGTLELWLEQTLFEESIEVSRSQSLQQLLKDVLEEIASFGIC